MLYPHNINRKRLQQLYVDLPKEIKPEYETFVNRYAKHSFNISFVTKRRINEDASKIIELVRKHKEKEQ